MTCQYYNSTLSICKGGPCGKSYNCQRINVLKEMEEQLPQKPSIEIIAASVIPNIDLNELKRILNSSLSLSN